MHSQTPPVIHRDLKVTQLLENENLKLTLIKAENVLATKNGIYKLCDFGSATTKAIEPISKGDIAELEEEVQKYTTMQYR